MNNNNFISLNHSRKGKVLNVVFECVYCENVKNLSELSKELVKQVLSNCFTNFKTLALRVNCNNPKNLETQITKHRNHLFKYTQFYDEILFNINVNNLHLKSKILEIAEQVHGKVYFISNLGDLVVLSQDMENQYEDDLYEKQNEKQTYESLILKSLKFDELDENRQLQYDILDNKIIETGLGSKEVSDNLIILKNSDKNHCFIEAIKLFKIEGVQFHSREKIKSKDVFFNNLFKGLTNLTFKLVRVILNKGDGISYYLGVKVSGNDFKQITETIELHLELLINLLRSIFPGVDITELDEYELSNSLDFIENRQIFGSIVGYTKTSVSNRFLRELENSIKGENWGLMTISENLTDDTISSIIKDLKLENITAEPEINKESSSENSLEIFDKIISRHTNEVVYETSKIMDYFYKNTGSGLWNTCNYIFSDKKIVYETISSIVKANYKPDTIFWFSLKIIKLDHALKQFPLNFKHIDIGRVSYNISKEFKLLNTIYSSKDLGDFIHFPSKSLRNFNISFAPEFNKAIPKNRIENMYNPINIGVIKNNPSGTNEFKIDSDSLTRHCLVMGATGSGKTNTIMNLLLSLRKDDKRVPFLIIEPIKKEYRNLLNYEDELEVFTAGSKINPLKINIFEVPHFLTYSQWVNELLDIICISFYIWEPLRGVILNCLNEIYQLNGWTEEKRGRTPTMEEFVKFSKLKIECTSYNFSTRSSHLGAFENRFESMISGARGFTFNVYESSPQIEDILRKPMVIELDGLRNDDERAFVFNFILNTLYLYVQEKGDSRHLRHITVIEEAHRLLGVKNSSSDAQQKSISSKAQERFSDILAEIRTYGLGMIIAEQKPQQLNKVAITNTNTKICHKLPSRQQIEDFKDSLGLLSEHLQFITRLNPGECILSIEGIDEPYLIQVDLVKNEEWIEKTIQDSEIYENIYQKSRLEDLHYTISYDHDSNEYIFAIEEIVWQYNGVKRHRKRPTRKQCLNFLNFKDLLWKKLKHFYTNYKICLKCRDIIKTTRRQNCTKCSNRLREIPKLRFKRFNDLISCEVITNNITVDRLHEKQKQLFPAEYSRDYQNSHARLKQEFDQLRESIQNFENSADSTRGG